MKEEEAGNLYREPKVSVYTYLALSPFVYHLPLNSCHLPPSYAVLSKKTYGLYREL